MLVAEVQKLIPGFTVNYDPCPIRSEIAASWPRSIDDIEAQNDWGWKYQDSMYELSFKILDNIDVQYKTSIIDQKIFLNDVKL